MYDHNNQYRCTIVRGRVLSKIELADSFLPLYAKIIAEICPSPKEDFNRLFEIKLAQAHPDLTDKALKNHRTEMTRSLLAMWYEDAGVVQVSPRVEKYLLESGSTDQPAFFKDLLFKYQTPNCADSIKTAKQRIQDGVQFRNYCAILKLLISANERGLTLNQREIGYYFLNSFDVLRGEASEDEVLQAIEVDRKAGNQRRVAWAGHEESYNTQHIREQLNLLVLANLVRFSASNGETEVNLNLKESAVLRAFAKDARTLPFTLTLSELDVSPAQASERWQAYFASTSKEMESIALTTIDSLTNDQEAVQTANIAGSSEIGAAGENYVFAYEKRRVAAYKKSALSRVRLVANIKGLGYDVHSVRAEAPDPDHSIHIEVKSTKRVTLPDFTKEPWSDTFTMTRNEWRAADTLRSAYLIYRVYFTRDRTVIHRIEDPLNKAQHEPLSYQVEYDVVQSVVREMPEI